MKEFDLHSKKIKSGFEIPEKYFESFESKIMAKVSTEAQPKVVSLFNKKQIWISAIAAVFVAMLAIPFYFNSVNNTTVETTTLENYLTNELNTYEIVDNLTTEDILSLENEVIFNDDAIENYLLEQNLDYYLNE
jgi:hypothetical protein